MSATQNFPLNMREGKQKVRPASFANFHEIAPAEATADGGRTWCGRSEYLVVTYTEGPRGMALNRRGQADEYFAVLPDAAMSAQVEADGQSLSVPGRSVVIVPPGDSTIRLRSDGRLIRMLPLTSARDVAEHAFNAEQYREPDHYIQPYTRWPAPPSGFRLRPYQLDSYGLDLPGFDWTRVFRCSNSTVNYVLPIRGSYILNQAQDKRMSAHRHASFDQIILFLEGTFRVHTRVPWTEDIRDWHDDEHWLAEAPSFLAIPPQVWHSVEGIGSGTNHVIDLFSPPRADYTALNRDEYPLP